MKQYSAWLTMVRHPVDDVRRRGQILIGILGSIIGLNLGALLGVWLIPDPMPYVLGLGSATGVQVIAIYMARRGKIIVSTWLAVIVMMSIIVLPTLLTRQIDYPLAYLVIPVLVAGLVLHPWHVVVVGLSGMAVIGGCAWVVPPPMDSVDSVALPGAMISHALIITFVCGVLSFVASRINDSAFKAIAKTQQRIDQDTHVVATLHDTLAQTIHDRTADLATALTDLQSHTATQAHLIAAIDQQRAVIRAMSVPMLPVAPHVLVVPLIGILDRDRLALLQDNVLHAVQQQTITHVVLDITGVEVVDSRVVQELLNLIPAAGFLGAAIMLVGIRPEVAQAIVTLGLELKQLRTAATLQEGLQLIPKGSRS